MKSRGPFKDKKVVIVGFGKSATDAALESAAVAERTTMIFRRTHWPVPQKLAGVLPFKWGMLSRLTSALIPLYYRPSAIERFVHLALRPLVWFWWRLVELLLFVQCGLGSRFGTRVSLVPAEPIEIGSFLDATMVPRPAFYRSLRRGSILPQRSEIERYTENGVLLKNGENIEADVVVLGTGWESDFSFLGELLLDRLDYGDDGFHLYRQMVHPEVPGLVFVGWAATFENMLTDSLQARWLADLIAGRHHLPTDDAMLQDLADMKAWKQSWMQPGETRGASLNLHMLHYHDQLVKDTGANPLRKKGIFAPLKEVFAPYQPSDYRDVV